MQPGQAKSAGLTVMTDLRLIVLLSIATLFRWSITMFPYSGKGVAPMFGDYEAQRHWQEITVNLPVYDWYKNTSDNDLLYWGLDYPPLTAYHSLLVGKTAEFIQPSWTALNESRGTESVTHKLFMRYSVLLSDLVIYYPAAIMYSFTQNSQQNAWLILVGLMFYPGIAVIDYGHFQYNGVSLGLFILAVTYLQRKQLLMGAILFTLSLNYKQMELYHAIPFFIYLLSTCFIKGEDFRIVRLAKVGMVTIGTFALCWLPFITKAEDTLAVLQRLFPFSRGLFEDKVANAWCSLSVVIKIRNLLPAERVVQLCTVTTLLSVVPSSIKLFIRPSIRNFKISLMISSLAFFLFSYQVHEKSILIAGISALLLLDEETFATVWFCIISTFSMLPLLIKDGLALATILSTFIFIVAMWTMIKSDLTKLHYALLSISTVGMVILTILSLFKKPPHRYPDLWPVLVSLYSFGHFILFYLYYNVRLIGS